MENNRYIEILKQGKLSWNEWRNSNPNQRADFSYAVLDNQDFEGYNLNNCNFYEASLQNCNFNKTELCWSAFFHCKLNYSTFINPETNYYSEETSFLGVNLRWSSFAETDLQFANIKGALFEGVHLHDCNLVGANISHSRIHGLSAWGNLVDSSTIQNDLIITPFGEPTIKIDNFEMAQFLYLLITNKNIRDAIDTLATKVVLILGSFAKEDKEMLDQIKLWLNNSNYIPVLFDFDKPLSRSLTETVSTIAHLSKFIIADLTNSRSIGHELASIIPYLRSVQIIPIIKEGQTPYSMFYDFDNLNNVSGIIKYKEDNIKDLVDNVLKFVNNKP